MPFKCLMERERKTLRTYGTREIFSARAEPLGVKIVPKHSKRCALLILTVHNKPRRRLGFLKSFYFLFFSFFSSWMFMNLCTDRILCLVAQAAVWCRPYSSVFGGPIQPAQQPPATLSPSCNIVERRICHCNNRGTSEGVMMTTPRDSLMFFLLLLSSSFPS